jgi:hypothetical protein
MTQNSENPNTEKMTLAEFEQRLPEFFATGTGSISDDPRLRAFLDENPDAAALVRDFESIVEAAQGMFDVGDAEPSDTVWQNIQSGLQSPPLDVSKDGIAAKPVD